jgi:outer membrane protein assembly factor BamB
MDVRAGREQDPLESQTPRRSPQTQGPQRTWFPIAWVAGLAALYAGFWINASLRQGDWGLVNSIGHGAIILGAFGLAVWTLRSSGLSWGKRLSAVGVPLFFVAGHYLQFSPLEAVHNGDVGIVGWRWRWAEPDQLLPPPPAAEPAAVAGADDWAEAADDYPRFLGTGYWAEAPSAAVDWDKLHAPPREVWRRAVGAGWSAFAVTGGYAVTQEQRGDQEMTVCYRLTTGAIAWTHADDVRWDPAGSGALGYPGPRATPTADAGRVYTQGATGVVNCLDMRSGALLWSRDTLREQGAENLVWGKAGSPLVEGGLVLISVGGTDNRSLAAYDAVSGELAWTAGSRRSSYASPIAAELCGERQILVVNEGFLTAHRIADGKVLWEHPWPSGSGSDAAASQPVPLGDDRVFLSKGYGTGSTVLRVQLGSDGAWSTSTVWARAVMKTKMGNVVVRDGHAYGLDEVYLQCIDLATGRSQWKKRRTPSFGHGQILLVDGKLLVLTEEGEAVFAEATPDGYREFAAFPAVSGLTWNNPAVAGRWLVIRNAQEAACFELPLVAATPEL